MGHGYIKPENGGAVPVRRYAVELAGYATLEVGQRIRYEMLPGLDGRPTAACLRLIG